MKKSVFDKIKKLTMFTMTESFEKDDTCLGIYKKSLLYLIRGALEEESGAEILGLQECLKRDKALAVLLGNGGLGCEGRGDVVPDRRRRAPDQQSARRPTAASTTTPRR